MPHIPDPFTQRSQSRGLPALFLILAAILTACAASIGGGEPTATAVPTPTPVPTPFSQGLAFSGWRESAHAAAYALEKGPNTYCARCHSPENWDPAATIDPPPNCVSCKFPNEPEPRLAEGNPLVPESAWQGIDCSVCHRVDEHDIVDPAAAWFDNATGFYENVSSNSALCARCHRDTDNLRHARDLGEAAHAAFACTDCHDPHDLLAGCNGGGCHTDLSVPLPAILPEHADQMDTSDCKDCHAAVRDIHMNFLEETPVHCMECHGPLMGEGPPEPLRSGHGAQHQEVACIACHDASELEVGPLEETGEWTTFRTTDLMIMTTTKPYASHTIRLEVDCARCHFEDNPWQLAPDVLDEKLADDDTE